MKKKLAQRIAKEVVYQTYICSYCERKVPNFSFLTSNGCIWCDSKYWQKKLDTKK